MEQPRNIKSVFEFKAEDNTPELGKPTYQSEIFGMFQTVTEYPTGTPTKMIDQIKLHVDSLSSPTTFRLFVYFPIIKDWRSVDLPAGPSASASLSPSISPSTSPS